MQIGYEPHPLADAFIREMELVPHPLVLELGTLRADPDFPTHHRGWISPVAQYEMGDIEPGPDVTIVLDAHHFHHDIANLDAIIAVAVFEHLERPWLAMNSIFHALRRGGLVYVQTHQTFVLHGYPRDYWRFSREALALLAEDAGLEVLGTSYSYPVKLVPQVAMSRWNDAAQAYLCVDLLARRP